MRIAFLLFLGAIALSFSVSAQDVGPVLKKRDKAVMDFAGSAGKLAGAATYCKVDDDTLALYLSRVDSRIASIARDEVELVVARAQFKNIQTTAKSKLPAEGCAKVRENLNLALKSLRELR